VENFVRQNGFAGADGAVCAHQFRALMLQPRLIALVVIVGLAFQAWLPFLCGHPVVERFGPASQSV
jgi:hypothetical protein